jgi:hypothetical protein
VKSFVFCYVIRCSLVQRYHFLEELTVHVFSPGISYKMEAKIFAENFGNYLPKFLSNFPTQKIAACFFRDTCSSLSIRIHISTSQKVDLPFFTESLRNFIETRMKKISTKNSKYTRLSQRLSDFQESCTKELYLSSSFLPRLIRDVQLPYKGCTIAV